jgi:hypothetical protein
MRAHSCVREQMNQQASLNAPISPTPPPPTSPPPNTHIHTHSTTSSTITSTHPHPPTRAQMNQHVQQVSLSEKLDILEVVVEEAVGGTLVGHVK